jgi:hypothetical protein
MRRMLMPVLSALLLLGYAAGVRAAGDDVKAILEKAVKAHGGEDALNKYKASQLKSKGKMMLPMVGEAEFTQEVSTMMPDKIKESMELEIANQKIQIRNVINGDKISINVAGMDIDVTDGIKEAVKEAQYLMKAVRLPQLAKGDKDYELSLLGEVKVEGKPTVGVRIASKGHKDISLYFDKDTGLMAKVEHRATDPTSMKEFTEERIILEYQKNKDGIPQAKKILIKRDGEKFMEAEVIEAKMLEKLDDSEFQK